MSAPALPSTSSRLGLTSSLRVHRSVISLVAVVLFLTDCVLLQDPLEPVTPRAEYVPDRSVVIAREGDRAVLPCGIRDLGTKQVAWKRVDEQHFMAIAGEKWVKDDAISMDARQEDLTDLTFWDLIFDPVRPDHAGVYECQISAKVKQSRNITLRVEGPPIKKALPDPHLELKGEKYVELGQKILLTCTVHTGHHVHQDIDWFKDGNKLVSNSKQGIVITKYNSAVTKSLVSELIIDHSRSRDSGTYICRSAWDKIDIQSLKVTVLNADTTNVKREGVPDSSEKYNQIRSNYGGGSSTSLHSQQTFTSSVMSLLVSLTLTLCL